MMPRIVIRETDIPAPPGAYERGMAIEVECIWRSLKKDLKKARQAVANTEVLKYEKKEVR